MFETSVHIYDMSLSLLGVVFVYIFLLLCAIILEKLINKSYVSTRAVKCQMYVMFWSYFYWKNLGDSLKMKVRAALATHVNVIYIMCLWPNSNTGDVCSAAKYLLNISSLLLHGEFSPLWFHIAVCMLSGIAVDLISVLFISHPHSALTWFCFGNLWWHSPEVKRPELR